MTVGQPRMIISIIERTNQGSRRHLTLQQEPMSMKMSMIMLATATDTTTAAPKPAFSPNPFKSACRSSRDDFVKALCWYWFCNHSCRGPRNGRRIDISLPEKKAKVGGATTSPDTTSPNTATPLVRQTELQEQQPMLLDPL